MRLVNVHEVKTNFSKLMDVAVAGEEVLIAKASKPFSSDRAFKNFNVDLVW
ncbi:MAG: type II toxin-antitoxin system Phd/YefM family antitoxin [Gammaproteobacteria bacterium]